MPAPFPARASVAHGIVMFEDTHGRLHVAVIVKATYAMRHRGLAEPAPPLPLFEDVYRESGGARPRSLHAPSDFVPWKPLADVVVVGRVYPRREGVTRQVVGVSLARGPDILLQKHLVAVGERSHAKAGGAPLAPMPLAWEMTWRGRENPSGLLAEDGESARIIDPDRPGEPAGLGPIAPEWPSRAGSLTPEHAEGLRRAPMILPDELDLRFFQCAPRDQQIPHLLGGEQILLTGLHPDHPVFHCRLPAQHAFARLQRPGAAAQSVPLVGDTLWIDAERGLLAITYRGSLEIGTSAEAGQLLAEASAWTVSAGTAPCVNVEETVGTPRAWSALSRERASAVVPATPMFAGPNAPSPTVDPIPLLNVSGFTAGCLEWSLEPPARRRVVVVKATFDLAPGGKTPTLAPTQDRLRGDEPVAEGALAELSYASDFVPWKPQADVLLRGTAHAPPDKPTALVRLEVGAVTATVAALGPRGWDANGNPTRPGTFVPVPLRYENAFGGAGYAANPAGTGFVPGTPPPRLEDPDRLLRTRQDRVSPACFGPIAPAWPARRSLLGSFDAKWRQERWPYLPANLDERFFQAAPPHLRCEHLRGDEPFSIDGVRADGKRFSGELPGLRARVFVVRGEADPFEVLLHLDTVVFDTDAVQLSLTWRGSFELDRSEGTLERIVVLREDLRSPCSAEDLAAKIELLAHPWLVADSSTSSSAPKAASSAGTTRFGDVRRAAALAVAGGVFGARAARALQAPPRPPRPPTRTEIEKRIEAGESINGLDLSGADLRGIDLSRQDLSGAILARAKLAGARFAAATLVGANLTDIDAPDSVWDGADLSRADLTRARLERASLAGVKLPKAVLAGASLCDARLGDIAAQGANLAGADLSRSRLDAAHLERADLSRARFTAASLGAAHLEDAKLYEVQGEGAVFDEASLPDSRFEKANLVKASFRKAAAPGAVWECADLSEAVFAGADVTGGVFSGARLEEANLVGIAARGAVFRGADLSRAVLDGADLMNASFEGARLTGASVVGASLFQAEVHDASLDGADLSEALVAGTKLDK